jgi:hypothetical protein
MIFVKQNFNYRVNSPCDVERKATEWCQQEQKASVARNERQRCEGGCYTPPSLKTTEEGWWEMQKDLVNCEYNIKKMKYAPNLGDPGWAGWPTR